GVAVVVGVALGAVVVGEAAAVGDAARGVDAASEGAVDEAGPPHPTNTRTDSTSDRDTADVADRLVGTDIQDLQAVACTSKTSGCRLWHARFVSSGRQSAQEARTSAFSHPPSAARATCPRPPRTVWFLGFLVGSAAALPFFFLAQAGLLCSSALPGPLPNASEQANRIAGRD